MEFLKQLFQKPTLVEEPMAYEPEVYVAGAIGVIITVVLCIKALTYIWFAIEEKLFDDLWIRIWKGVACVGIAYVGYRLCWMSLDKAPEMLETFDSLVETGKTLAVIAIFLFGALLCWFKDL